MAKAEVIPLHNHLARYDAMCTAISECYEVDEVKDIRDKAMAMERYAQQAMNTDAEVQARKIRLRAERRVGELTREMTKSVGGRPQKNSSHGDTSLSDPTKTEALAKAGVTKQQASKWERLASIPDADFEAALADTSKKPSTTGLIRKTTIDEMPKVSADALWIWGKVRDFDERNFSAKSTSVIKGEMAFTMINDMVRILPSMIEWLKELNRSMSND
jgi:transcriptional regulator with XRE-family HTH domain